MSNPVSEKRKPLLNTATDPSVFMSGGTGFFAWPDVWAVLFTVVRGGMCFATRLTTEFNKAKLPLPACLPDEFKEFAKNKGASLDVSGLFLTLAALSTALNASGPADYKKGIALTLFSFALYAFGTAADDRKSERRRSVANAVGTTSLNTGLGLAAGENVPAGIYGLYALSTLSSWRLLLNKKMPYGAWQPDLLISGGSGWSAWHAFTTASDPFFATAQQVFYCLGYASLAALKKYGGVVEWAQEDLKPVMNENGAGFSLKKIDGAIEWAQSFGKTVLEPVNNETGSTFSFRRDG